MSKVRILSPRPEINKNTAVNAVFFNIVYVVAHFKHTKAIFDLFDKNTIPGIEMVDGWVIKGEKSLSGVLDISNVRGIAGGAFVGCTELTDVVFPNDIESIGNVTFENCTGLIEIVIPSKVDDIGVSVFYGCTNLRKVFLPLACKDHIDEGDVFRGTSRDLQIIYYCNATIIMNANGGELSGGLSISTITGVAIGTLPTPTRDGYTFLGWYEDGVKVTKLDTADAENKTYYATWRAPAAVVYTITFEGTDYKVDKGNALYTNTALKAAMDEVQKQFDDGNAGNASSKW